MCGICGVYVLSHEGLPDIAAVLETLGIERIVAERIVEQSPAASALNFLLVPSNNRGHDSSGIVTFDGKSYHSHRGMGFAKDVFYHGNSELHIKTLENLVGDVAIGQDRYATTGLPKKQNIQPFEPLDIEGLPPITVAHNGNIVNEKSLRGRLRNAEKNGKRIPLRSTTDSELIMNSLILSYEPNLPIEEIVSRALKEEREFLGAYSLIGLVDGHLFAVRDSRGYWPLHMARLGNLIVFNSEIVPIKKFIRAANYKPQRLDFIKSVGRGELEVINGDSLETHVRVLFRGMEFSEVERRCAFDYLYLLSHDDPEVRKFRRGCGKLSWEKFGIRGNKEDYIVTPVPNSGVEYAKGYSKASGIKYARLIRRKKDVRTFQEPTPEAQIRTAEDKYRFLKSYEGLKVVLTDDSIVRRTTMTYIVKQMRIRGVDELHVRIGAPPIITPCYLGIHTPTRDELLAHHVNEAQIEQYFACIFYGVDYERDTLISLLKEGKSIEQIVAQSVIENKNYLKDPKLREVKEGKFSLKYPSSDDLREAFDRTGLNAQTKCYACMMPNWDGYPEEFRQHLPKISSSK